MELAGVWDWNVLERPGESSIFGWALHEIRDGTRSISRQNLQENPQKETLRAPPSKTIKTILPLPHPSFYRPSLLLFSRDLPPSFPTASQRGRNLLSFRISVTKTLAKFRWTFSRDFPPRPDPYLVCPHACFLYTKRWFAPCTPALLQNRFEVQICVCNFYY